MVHFILKCSKLEKKRDPAIINRNINDPEERMKDLLFRNKDHIRVSKQVRELWILRRDLLKEIKKGKTPENQ